MRLRAALLAMMAAILTPAVAKADIYSVPPDTSRINVSCVVAKGNGTGDTHFRSNCASDVTLYYTDPKHCPNWCSRVLPAGGNGVALIARQVSLKPQRGGGPSLRASWSTKGGEDARAMKGLIGAMEAMGANSDPDAVPFDAKDYLATVRKANPGKNIRYTDRKGIRLNADCISQKFNAIGGLLSYTNNCGRIVVARYCFVGFNAENPTCDFRKRDRFSNVGIGFVQLGKGSLPGETHKYGDNRTKARQIVFVVCDLTPRNGLMSTWC